MLRPDAQGQVLPPGGPVAVYASVGYSWKKTDTTSSPYNDLAADKLNIAIGYKHSL